MNNLASRGCSDWNKWIGFPVAVVFLGLDGLSFSRAHE